ncbi:hypothetical protein ACFQV4_36785 [Streptomyces thermocarboxydus]
MDARPHPAEPEAASAPAPAPDPDLEAALAVDPDPRPTPPRGFDAVAEAVLGDEPAAPAGSPLADPMERINEAVRAGRIDTAARLADETLEHAAQTLGAEHPEVLRLRELTAYIAYLVGEPVRAFRLSLDLAVACRRAGDEEAAYGNVRSAATAWRGARSPARARAGTRPDRAVDRAGLRGRPRRRRGGGAGLRPRPHGPPHHPRPRPRVIPAGV